MRDSLERDVDRSRIKTARRILKLAGPAMLSRIGILALAIIDSVMVGRIGVDELAYFAVAAQPQHSLAAVGQGFVAGLPPKVVESQMRRDDAESARWLAAALVVSAALGLVLAGILALGEVLLRAAHQPPDLAAAGEPVLRAFAWGMPAALMFWAASLCSESLGRPHLPLYVVLAAIAVKFPLNLFLVNGITGVVDPLGAVGAAISTSIIRWLMLIAILWLVSISVLPWTKFDWLRGLRSIGPLMHIGVPVAFATFFEAGGFLMLAAFAGVLGAEALAGYQIARSIYQVPFIFSIAIGLSTSIFLARAVSAGDISHANRVVRVSVGLNAIVAIGSGALVAAFPTAIGRLFTDDVAFLASLGVALLLTAALIVFDGFQGFLYAALRGISDGLVPSLAQLAAFWVVAVPLAYILAFRLDLGLEGVLGGLTLGLGVASALLGIRLFSHWRLRRATH